MLSTMFSQIAHVEYASELHCFDNVHCLINVNDKQCGTRQGISTLDGINFEIFKIKRFTRIPNIMEFP